MENYSNQPAQATHPAVGRTLRTRRDSHPTVGRPPRDRRPNPPLRQRYLYGKEPECRIAAFWNITPSIRQLHLPLHLQPRHKRIACTIGRMAELKHRLAALHPEARYLEIITRLSTVLPPVSFALNFRADAHKFKTPS